MRRGHIALIVTHRKAQEVDGVIDALREMGLTTQRWNLCEYPERATATLTRSSLTVSGDERATVDLPDVGWMHDCGSFSIAVSMAGLGREVSLRECEAFWEGALTSLNCEWLNKPSQIYLASSKLYQLKLAERLNIPLPDYCATNDSQVAASFAQSRQNVIVKAIRGGFLLHPEKNVKFFTRRLRDIESSIYGALKYGPLLFQEEVQKLREIRVTVVDEQCFSMNIDCEDLPDKIVDVRKLDFHRDRRRFSPARDVEQVERWSRDIVHELGLSYAGLDWAITASGEAYFLECNPLGSFKWSELCIGRNITQAIAEAIDRRILETPGATC